MSNYWHEQNGVGSPLISRYLNNNSIEYVAHKSDLMRAKGRPAADDVNSKSTLVRLHP